MKIKIILLFIGILLLSIISVQLYRSNTFNINTYISENEIISNIEGLWMTFHQNEVLKDKIANIEQLKVEKQHLDSENKLLGELKNTVKEYEEYKPIAATVILRDLDPNDPQKWYNTLLIDKGKEDNIRENTPVLTSKGLIGQVHKVYDKTASIKLLTSTTRRNLITATVENDHSVSGMIENYDLENNHLLFTKIDLKEDIEIGSIVTTSNISSYYPPNLKIGEIVEVNPDNYGLTKTAKIKPLVDFTDISYVILLQNFK